ncbi:MAG: type II secretion system protein [Parcubacteria group bacterium]
MTTKFNRGFTLIELLVVIAIIGILSSVVLASLNTARGKGSDAAIKSNLANIRAQAEIIYDNNNPNSYTGTCSNANVVAQMNSANSAAGTGTNVSNTLTTAGTATQSVCHDSAGAWAAGVPLKTSSANSWCVDSTGTSKLLTASFLGANATVCP